LLTNDGDHHSQQTGHPFFWAQDALESLVHVLRLMKASLGVIMGTLKPTDQHASNQSLSSNVGFAPETMVDEIG